MEKRDKIGLLSGYIGAILLAVILGLPGDLESIFGAGIIGFGVVFLFTIIGYSIYKEKGDTYGKKKII